MTLLDDYARYMCDVFADARDEARLGIALMKAADAFDEAMARLTLKRLCERGDGAAEIRL